MKRLISVKSGRGRPPARLSGRPDPLILTTIFFLLLTSGYAGQVVHDGTVGPAGALTGSAYVIPDTAGTTRGNNLFHSFGQFNLDTGDSATFTGPDTIRNIITRVTGGSASTIDGTIDTTGMPNANFFFINPFGVIFGPNATVNVGGSLAVTTADYVKLADGGRFDARHPANDILTAAPVSSFGFLGPTVAPITFDGPTESDLQYIFTYVPDGKSIWIVGGDIQHQGSYLVAPGGEVALVSVASAGELAVDVEDPRANVDTTAFAKLGNITLNNGTEYVDGTTGGQVVLEADRINLSNNSGASSWTEGDMDGGDIICRARSEIDIRESSVGMVASGNGDAGDVYLTAPSIQLTDMSLASTTVGNGRAGDIFITADNFSYLGTGAMTVSSQGPGAGGNLTIMANRVLLQGGRLYALGFGGPAGNITVQADVIELRSGAELLSDAISGGFVGGDIHLTANTLIMDGANISSRSLTAIGDGAAGGGAGNIILDVGQLQLNHAEVTTTTESAGAAGNITIRAGDAFVVGGSSVASASTSEGAAGSIILQLTGSLTLQDASQINVSAAQAAGGDITVTVGQDLKLDHSRITAQAYGDGGNIHLTVPGLLYVLDSQLIAHSETGNGGNVTIDPALTVLNQSSIIASAIVGNGGNIDIVSDYFLNSGSTLDASSEFGLQGTVTIRSPDADLSGELQPLNVRPLDAESLLKPHCSVRLPRGVSTFTVAGRGGWPVEPDALQPAFP